MFWAMDCENLINFHRLMNKNSTILNVHSSSSLFFQNKTKNGVSSSTMTLKKFKEKSAEKAVDRAANDSPIILQRGMQHQCIGGKLFRPKGTVSRDFFIPFF
jgi:hypothetical protein